MNMFLQQLTLKRIQFFIILSGAMVLLRIGSGHIVQVKKYMLTILGMKKTAIRFERKQKTYMVMKATGVSLMLQCQLGKHPSIFRYWNFSSHFFNMFFLGYSNLFNFL